MSARKRAEVCRIKVLIIFLYAALLTRFHQLYLSLISVIQLFTSSDLYRTYCRRCSIVWLAVTCHNLLFEMWRAFFRRTCKTVYL